MCSWKHLLCLAVSAPPTPGQHQSQTQRHATQCCYGQHHPGAERGTGSHLWWQQMFVSHTVSHPFLTKPKEKCLPELIIVSDLLCMCVFSGGVQRWRQREEMWWTGGPSVWISGSFGSLGSFCLHSWNNKKVNNKLQGEKMRKLQTKTKWTLLM